MSFITVFLIFGIHTLQLLAFKFLVGIEIDAATYQSSSALRLYKNILTEFENLNHIKNELSIVGCIYSSQYVLNETAAFEDFKEIGLPVFFSSGIYPSMCLLDFTNIRSYDYAIQVNSNSKEFCMNCETSPFVAKDLSFFILSSTCANQLILKFDLPGYHAPLSIKGNVYFDRNDIAAQINDNLLLLDECSKEEKQDYKHHHDISPPTYTYHDIDHFHRQAPDKYHSSGPCNLWWPLNNSELFTFASMYDVLPDTHQHRPEDEERLPFLFICPSLAADQATSFQSLVGVIDVIQPNGQVNAKLRKSFQVGRVLTSPTDAAFVPYMVNVRQTSTNPSASTVGRDSDQTLDAAPILQLRFSIVLPNSQKNGKNSFTTVSSFQVSIQVVFADSHGLEGGGGGGVKGQVFSAPLHPMVSTLYSRDKLALFLNALQHNTGTFVEVGVNKGEFSSLMMRQWYGNRYILVDPWQTYDQQVAMQEYVDRVNLNDRNENMMEALRAVKPFGTRACLMRMTSVQAASLLCNHSVDVVYIDGLHHYQGVMDDIVAWYPKLKSGGIILGHDYMLESNPTTIFTVKPAVNEFARKMNLVVFHTPDDEYPTWFMFKP